ncbi:hypothetical protein D210916BOD24_02190 [Alteromonas sp. D210916BOD_24]|uniref:energy transducer TonB n=1 Tax=Alteromonas sp. D210916BOD_24 TaxID=3157618 RepID=UPI00399C98A4
MNKIVLLACIGLFLTACASKYNSIDQHNEKLDLTHSVEEAENYWVLSKRISPKYPVQAAKQHIAGCSRFKISINSEGETTDAELIESYPNNAFIGPSQEVINKWAWQPTPQNSERKPITRMIQMDFYMPQAVNYDKAKAHCAVGAGF